MNFCGESLGIELIKSKSPSRKVLPSEVPIIYAMDTGSEADGLESSNLVRTILKHLVDVQNKLLTKCLDIEERDFEEDPDRAQWGGFMNSNHISTSSDVVDLHLNDFLKFILSLSLSLSPLLLKLSFAYV